MSYLVTEIVQTQSRSKYGARTLAMVLSEIAHKDGVGWATIDFDESDPQWKKERSLAYLCNLGERQVRRALALLQQLDELETVIAFDGRRRFYAHRLILGKLRGIPVDYGRGLPRLAAPFWTPAQLRLPPEERPLDGHVAPWIPRQRPDNMSTRQSAESGATTGQTGRSRVDSEVHSHSPGTGPSSDALGSSGPGEEHQVREQVEKSLRGAAA